jgi:hypothetical protein
MNILTSCEKFKLDYLRYTCRPYYLHFTNGEEYLTFKALKRGTKEYSQFFLRRRFREIRKVVNRLLRVDKRGDVWGYTNGVLLTYTFDDEKIQDFLKKHRKTTIEQQETINEQQRTVNEQQEVSDVDKVFASWEVLKRFSMLWSRVKKRLERRGFKILFKLRVAEAQRTGRAHLHIIIILNDKFLFRFDPVKKRGFIKKQSLFSDLQKIFDLGLGFIDIQPIYSKNQAMNYLTKYILKNGEGFEFNFDEFDLSWLDNLRESDIKRLLGLFYLKLFRLRFYSTSGVYRKLDKGFRYNNNLDADRGWVRLQGEGLRVWADYLKSVGLGDFAFLGVSLIRGSPEKGLKVLF